MTRALMICAQWGGLTSSVLFIVITCGQIRAFGYRNWRRFGMGVGVDASKDVEQLIKEDEAREEREERLLRAIEVAEYAIEHGYHG